MKSLKGRTEITVAGAPPRSLSLSLAILDLPSQPNPDVQPQSDENMHYTANYSEARESDIDFFGPWGGRE